MTTEMVVEVSVGGSTDTGETTGDIGVGVDAHAGMEGSDCSCHAGESSAALGLDANLGATADVLSGHGLNAEAEFTVGSAITAATDAGTDVTADA